MRSRQQRPVTSPRGRVWIVGLVWTLVVTGAVLVRAGVDAPAWSGWLPSTVVYWSDIAVLSSVGAATFCGWMVLPLRSRRTGEWVRVSARTRRELVASAIVISSATTAAGASAALLMMVGWSIWTGADSTVLLPRLVLWWVGTVAAITAFASLGGLLAWWMRNLVVLVVAPALTYLALLLPLYTLEPPPWSFLYATVAESWTEIVPTLAGVIARAGVWLGLAATTAALLSGRRSAAWLAAMLASLSLTVGLFVAPARTTIPEAAGVVCANGQPTVCTRAPWQAGLDKTAAIIGEGYAALPAPLIPKVIGSDPDAAPLGTKPNLIFQASGGVSAPTNLPNRASTLAALGDAVFTNHCQQVGQAQLTLLMWWRLASHLPLNKAVRPGDFVPETQLTPQDYQRGLRQAETLDGLPRQARDQWFTSHAAGIRGCSLTVADLP